VADFIVSRGEIVEHLYEELGALFAERLKTPPLREQLLQSPKARLTPHQREIDSVPCELRRCGNATFRALAPGGSAISADPQPATVDYTPRQLKS